MRQVVNPRNQTPRGRPDAKLETTLQIIIIAHRKSDGNPFSINGLLQWRLNYKLVVAMCMIDFIFVNHKINVIITCKHPFSLDGYLVYKTGTVNIIKKTDPEHIIILASQIRFIDIRNDFFQKVRTPGDYILLMSLAVPLNSAFITA